jgi:FkbM family methyltransferase
MISIVIPTYNHLEDCLKPCVESILQYTDMTQVELIIVANGCTDGTKDYLVSLNERSNIPYYNWMWFDEPIGYTKAINEGICAAQGEIVVLMNNDLVLMADNWLDILTSHFEDKKVGMTGPCKFTLDIDGEQKECLAFWLVAIRASLFKEIGLPDEIFNPGGSEDGDFSIRVGIVGYKLIGVPENISKPFGQGHASTDFPVYHQGSATFGHIEDGGLFERNHKLLIERYSKKKLKISIVIPTYNHLDDCLKPCIISIVKYTDLSNIEVIVSANGCKDATKEYVESLGSSFKLLWSEEPLGFTKATNEGIKAAQGEFILLLNNDTVLLDQPKNQWIELLLDPFRNTQVGMTGPLLSYCPHALRIFFIFFCVMIRKSLFDQLGLLDEIFTPGGGEDTDFSIKAQNAGYILHQVPTKDLSHDSKQMVGGFPIWHQAEATVHDEKLVSNWEQTFSRNSQILKERYAMKKNYDYLKQQDLFIYNEIFEWNVYDLKKEDVEGKIVLDIGGNLGFFTILCHDYGAKNIVTVEAHPLIYQWLIGNTKALPNVKTFNVAITDKCGETVEINNKGAASSIYLKEAPGEKVNTLTIEALMHDPISFIDPEADDIVLKLDCEGCEYDILLNMPDAVWSRIGKILLEIHADMHPIYKGRRILLDKLEEKGFVIENDRQLLVVRDNELVPAPGFTIIRAIRKPKGKISIVIPTYNHLDDCLKPCIESLVKNTDMNKILEVIVVANGCTDKTHEFVASYDDTFKLLWFKEPLGFTKAANAGLKEAKGDYVILLNNDVLLMDNTWLEKLIEPFEKDLKVGLVGPEKRYHEMAGGDFITFFCAAIRRELFDKIGYLDEIFSPGTCEDVDFSRKAVGAGYKLIKTEGKFPIEHKYQTTMSEIPGMAEICRRNDKVVYERHNKNPRPKEAFIKTSKPTVLCSISTKDRYFTTLPLAIQAVAVQTVPPDELVIFDDGEQKDLRQEDLYAQLFSLLDRKGIKWRVLFGARKGQHHNHQMANKMGYEFVWRIDDDDVPEPDVLERLLSHITPEVGAVAGSVITFGQINNDAIATNKIEDIFHTPNMQWSTGTGVFEVEHLYNSFIYRASIADYNLDLSPVAHREETLFTVALREKGYKLVLDRSIMTYHYKQTSGGIRAHNNAWFYEHDDRLFIRKLEEMGYKFFVLNSGLGDHFAFLNILPKLKEKYKHIVLGVCYHDVFEGCEVKTIPVGAIEPLFPEQNVYKFLIDSNWQPEQGNLVKAFSKMYGVEL